ncbi:MAG: fluoride efflux transporter FluC [Polymorphobacter sp.]|uniref:fluoride efflux transporter FluC n=1 Tax=Polymorphobacter sp. TaxID=1909290 RepID=UPI003A864E61
MTALSALPPVLLVALGGGVGAGLRYALGHWAMGVFGPGFPWGTWIINLGGSFLLGLLMARWGAESEAARLLLGVGLLGGFTTFSSFSVELVAMVGRGEAMIAAAYAVSSVAGGVMAAYLGIMLGRG